MEIFHMFSIADFLGYLFPGMFSLTGIYLLLLLTPASSKMAAIPETLGFWVFLLGLGYVLGVLQQGIAEAFIRRMGRQKRSDRNKGYIWIEDEKVKAQVIEAYNHLFGERPRPIAEGADNVEEKVGNLEWNKDRFYVCRSIVAQKMPLAGSSGWREGAYRQLLMNVTVSLAIWGIAGFFWGLHWWNDPMPSYFPAARFLVFGSPVIAALLIVNLLIVMDRHEKREVREVLTAFLAGYRTGAIKAE